MGAAAQTPFYKSWIEVGGVIVPCYPNGTQLACPVNYQVPPIIGNYWQWNYAPGLRQPMLSVQLCVRDKAAEVLGTTFLNYFLSRTSTVTNDSIAIGSGVRVWNGVRGFKMVNGVKANAFTIGSDGGGGLRFTASFIGVDFAPFSGGEATAAPTAFAGWDKNNVMAWNSVTWDAPLDSAVWNWNLSYSNNHSPDLSHNGTVFPTAQNAGMQSVGLSIYTQAATLPSAISPAGNGGFPAPVTPDTQTVRITGANVTRVFTLNNPILQNPDDLNISAPRNMNEFQFLCLGGNGISTPPLTVT